MIVGATNKSNLIVQGKADFGDNLFANAATFFNLIDVPRVFWNSIEISVIATVVTLAFRQLPATASRCSARGYESDSSPSCCCC